ncbi:hypothetical protein [Bacillus sp. FJAT-45350]|uniref:hypothetical protein n=1 Tax=Bacillus sp. FJAT-45350 TaxID=2011014 RepID=UPI000BB6EE4F|nr:hypothetical protein [Bacillus sp. FJAT-45350]
MEGCRRDVINILELILFWIIGFYLTVNFASKVYESYGISFMGNVWVNWFGISYVLLAVYSIIAYIFTRNRSNFYRGRMKSIYFWIIFIVSLYIVIIPFIKGENPF